jgi:hypothetical protein
VSLPMILLRHLLSPSLSKALCDYLHDPVFDACDKYRHIYHR